MLCVYDLIVYRDDDRLPPEAEAMFAAQLTDSRQQAIGLSARSSDRGFVLTCAVASENHVLRGVHLDLALMG